MQGMFRAVCAVVCAAMTPALAVAQHMPGPPETNSEYFDPADLMPDVPAPDRAPGETWSELVDRLEREGYQKPEGLHLWTAESIGRRWRSYDEPSLYAYS